MYIYCWYYDILWHIMTQSQCPTMIKRQRHLFLLKTARYSRHFAVRSCSAVLCQLAAISWSWSQKSGRVRTTRASWASSSLPGPQGWPRQIGQDVWTQASESPGVCRFACNMHVWNEETTDRERERERYIYIYFVYIYFFSSISYADNSIFLLTSHHLTSPHDFPSVISKDHKRSAK